MQGDLFFTDSGKGFPVIFIHGFCETSEMWFDFTQPFIEDYRVITVDLPGFGKSPLPTGDFTIKDVAKHVLNLLDKLEIQKCAAVGHSLGGYVLLEMVNTQPDRFTGFSLFHSTAFADDTEKKESRNKAIEFVEKRGVEVFVTSFVPPLFYVKNRKPLLKTIEKVVDIAATTPQNTLISYTKAMRDRPDRTDVLNSFDGPISFIAGDKDTSVPIEKTSEQVLIPKRAIVNILQDTGHMGMFEQQERTTEIIKDFLRLCTMPD
ncbi:alpha/beta hydrolase [Fulvivirga sp. RKSG066]|uniref:alpha/beta fold hydrolase n=1 Tax=Fulvivirga aurantia TaxID=2529383 RepID=UPI0012BBCA7F|nr:alpha/beta hydrolase [Fulvivirga aurantia]MTI21742.1 alpha/beta hydrolase [Fulvivirga aurantia]